jgi:two-component sensor histidine kinase
MPPGERVRIEALQRYEILDTPPEEAFDRITGLAARIFGTPISLVSLLDERRQWFKSRHGLTSEWTSRDVAFCAYTILGDAPMVVQDAVEDPRFAANPLVTGELGVRFYAGAPLRTSEGHALGTLCVIDQKPRHDFDAGDRAMLRDLADLVMVQLESRHAVRALRREVEERLRVEDQLRGLVAEKEVLMRETHHRVKNNMQSVVAMLEVERARLAPMPEAAARLEALGQRIVVLGRIHEQLYASGQFDRIDVPRQLRRLAEDMAEVERDRRISIAVEADDLACGIETAVPLGLIVNELLVNSLKHAFPAGRANGEILAAGPGRSGSGTPGSGGRITVTLRRVGEGHVDLSVADDGIGDRPGGKGPAVVPRSQGIGVLLVEALAGQIDATVAVERRQGWRTVVSIPSARFAPPA